MKRHRQWDQIDFPGGMTVTRAETDAVSPVADVGFCRLRLPIRGSGSGHAQLLV